MQELTVQELNMVSGGNDWADAIGISSGIGALTGIVLSPTATGAVAAAGAGAAVGAAAGVAFMGGYAIGSFMYDFATSGSQDWIAYLQNIGVLRP